MAKKKQFVTAAAAFAVAASAVAPAITADAASTTVRLSSDYVRVGDLDATLDKEYKGSEIYWYKSSVDMNKLGVFQTAKGFVKGQGIRVEKRVRVLNYAQEIKPESEFVFEQGVPVSGIRVQPVLFADGNEYAKPVSVAGFNTDKVGEFEGTLTYANRAYGVVTKTVKYKVVATKVELSEVKSEVMDDVLSVTADVKNLKDGEKVELVVYANRDMNAALPAVEAEVKDGKLSVKSAKLPAGNHSFILRSGEVKTEAMNFVVEAPMVKEVKAINAKELVVNFNKPVDKSTILNSDGEVLASKLSATSLDSSAVTLDGAKASLSADGMTLTIAATGSQVFSGKYVVRLNADAVKTVSGVYFPAYTSPVFTAEDTVRPTFTGLTYKATGEAVFSFSEALNASQADIASSLSVNGPTLETISASDVTIADDKKSFSIVLPSTMTLDANYTFAFTGLKDYANNIINPNPVSVTVVKSVRDNVNPTVTAVTPVDVNKVKVTFSEKIRPYSASVGADNAVVTVSGAVVNPAYELDSTGTVATFTTDATAAGVRTVAVTQAKDLAGNGLTAAYSKVVQFSEDNVAPGYVKHEVKTEGSDRYLVISFNEKLGTINGTVSGSYVDADNITRSTSASFFGSPLLSDDEMSVKVPLTADAVAGNYTLNLPTNFVEDASANTNGSAARSISFSLGNVVDTTKPEVSVFAQHKASEVTTGGLLAADSLTANNNKVTVKFDRAVTAATALNVSNYSIDGVSSPFTSAIFKGNAQTVELTLRDGAITTNGTRNFSIRNVATSTGSVMEVKNASYSFVENVRATVTSARVLSATQIEVTLSEALDETTDGGDFEIFQNGSTTPLVETSEVATGNKVVITVSPGLTSLTGLVVKPEATIDLADLNGNLVNFTGSVNVTN
ncbi:MULTISPECIES: hypothetical protein [Exiguobacterium]|uniref:hypothetical protein n=1 Tax=Exiguobacterium TaxID=33986 RepID=UPI0025C39C7D|nr:MULTISPECIES: hypothetical protein [Exiguobacterium]